MRLDLFLKHSRLIPRRTVAQDACEAGAVTVNGTAGKPGRNVNVGDTVVLRQRGRQTAIRVVSLPERAPSKADAAKLYDVVSVETYD